MNKRITDFETGHLGVMSRKTGDRVRVIVQFPEILVTGICVCAYIPVLPQKR
jgi:hypothetical protein